MLGLQVALQGGRRFTPASLFAAGEQGAWYDPSDFSAMFQDSAGTTPVTAVEQPVGLMLDKSKGLARGPELVTNGDFSNGATGWTLGPEWSVSGGAASKASGTSTTGIIQPVATANWIKVEFDIISISGSVSPQYVQQNLSNGATGPIFNSTGRKSCYIQKNANATGQMAVVFFTYNNTQTVTIDNISVRELPGNHAFQSTAASRPVLSARVNLLTATETLATQSVTTVATPHTLIFGGTGSITLSGTATGTYSAGTHTFTPTAGTLTLTVSGSVTQADLRTSNVGVGLPAYQRVTTSTNYDTAGFPLYLATDGVDDWYQTNSINFTGTDKMTVVAGVRKLSDAAVGIIYELSVNFATNGGAFLCSTADNGKAYLNISRGNANPSYFQGGFIQTAAAPDTAVLTSTHDISGDLSTMRRNAVAGTDGTADQGTGNYGNYPLFLFRRDGTSLPAQLHFFGLIVRGAASTPQQIAQAEAWMNQRTRAY